MASNAIFSIFGKPLSSMELLIAGAVLLFVAGVLLFFSRRRRFALDRSWATDEITLYLSRIADALERQALRPPDRIVVGSATPVENAAEPKLTKEAHTIPYSMFGREISPGH
jgi:hypothetical protein